MLWKLFKSFSSSIARIVKEGVNEAEMKRVRAQWLASTTYQRDSLFNQARELGNHWVEGLPLDTPDKMVDALVAITPQQVQDVAKKYFIDDQLTVATLIPQSGPRLAFRKPAPGSRHTEGTK